MNTETEEINEPKTPHEELAGQLLTIRDDFNNLLRTIDYFHESFYALTKYQNRILCAEEFEIAGMGLIGDWILSNGKAIKQSLNQIAKDLATLNKEQPHE